MLTSVKKKYLRRRITSEKHFDIINLFNNVVSVVLLSGFTHKVIPHDRLVKTIFTPYAHPQMVVMMLNDDIDALSCDNLVLSPTVLNDPQLFKQVYARSMSFSFEELQEARRAHLSMRTNLGLVLRRYYAPTSLAYFGTPSIGTLLLILHYIVKFEGVTSESLRFLNLEEDFGAEIYSWVDENVPELKDFPLPWILETVDLYI